MIRRNEYVSVHETRAQVTREKLLKAAIKLVNRDGMKQLTVRNICDEAGLSTGSFYNLFSGKEDLISYYLKYAFVPYREKALVESEPYNPIERILIIYRAYVVYCKDMGLEFVSGLYASNHNPFFDFLHRDSDDDFIIATVRSYIDEAKKQGLIRKEVDTDALRQLLRGSCSIGVCLTERLILSMKWMRLSRPIFAQSQLTPIR